MTTPRSGDEGPGVYRLPAGAFRFDDPEAGTQPPAGAAPEPVPEPAPARPRRRKGWDIALTIVLLVVLAIVAAAASVVALFLVYASDACGAGGRICRIDVLNIGVWVAFTSPWIVYVLTLVGAIVLLAVRRRAFWVPLAGFALTVLLWIAGAVLVWAAT